MSKDFSETNKTTPRDEQAENQQQASFESWFPTSQEPRKAIINKEKGLRDKRTTMKAAIAAHIGDGISLGIGGSLNTRIPVAVVHEIIRQGANDLTLSLQNCSLCSELLAGAMILDPDHLSIKRIELARGGRYDATFAALLRYLADTGLVRFDEYVDYEMSARFRAASYGVPFFPISGDGSDGSLKDRGKNVVCPFSGENVYTLPACRPDVGIIHVQAADMFGNARIFGPLCACSEISRAASRTILSVDQIIPKENIRNYPNLTAIPYTVVDEVVEQPFGATPGASYGHYGSDMPHFLEFGKICTEFASTGNRDKLQEYYDRNIFGCETFEDFLNLQPSSTLQEIIRKGGTQPIILT
jgi:glutaconate CoA-transferase, subunit A